MRLPIVVRARELRQQGRLVVHPAGAGRALGGGEGDRPPPGREPSSAPYTVEERRTRVGGQEGWSADRTRGSLATATWTVAWTATTLLRDGLRNRHGRLPNGWIPIVGLPGSCSSSSGPTGARRTLPRRTLGASATRAECRCCSPCTWRGLKTGCVSGSCGAGAEPARTAHGGRGDHRFVGGGVRAVTMTESGSPGRADGGQRPCPPRTWGGFGGARPHRHPLRLPPRNELLLSRRPAFITRGWSEESALREGAASRQGWSWDLRSWAGTRRSRSGPRLEQAARLPLVRTARM